MSPSSAEIHIQNTEWKLLGRRLFDICIQGNLMAKDFNIRKEADGASFTAVPKLYQAQVTANYLEKLKYTSFVLEKGLVVYQIKPHMGRQFHPLVLSQTLYPLSVTILQPAKGIALA